MNHDASNGAHPARSWRAAGAAGFGPGGGAAPTAPCPPVSPEGHGGAFGRAGARPGGRFAGVQPGPARALNGALNGAQVGAQVGANRHARIDGETVIYRLEEAGRTLLALPAGGYSTRLRTSRLDTVRSALEGYGQESGGGTGEQTRLRPPVPPAEAITRMDEAMGWIALIPADRYVLRRIVGARSLVSPTTERHLFAWRRLGLLLGADHKAVQRWHAQGIALIAAGLRRA
jgi:hypothetical protein